MASETPPGTPFPKSGRDTEVSSQRDSEPDKVLEASKAPGSGEPPPSMKGGLTTPLGTFVYAELPGDLLTALKNALSSMNIEPLWVRWLERFRLPKAG